jgi:hypothetical protein
MNSWTWVPFWGKIVDGNSHSNGVCNKSKIPGNAETQHGLGDGACIQGKMDADCE